MKGKLIVIEGMDGVGKTTQVQHIVEALNTVGQQAVGIREPGGTWLGEQLRTILKSEECQSLSPTAQMLLFAAARAQNVAERIKPLLDAGTWVVMDRFSPSTQVYQGELDKLSEAMNVEAVACQGLVPDLTFILDMDVERAALRRAESEKDAWDRKDMHVVRAAYITHAPKWNAVVLDADKSTNSLTEEIWMHLKPWLPGKCSVCQDTGWRELSPDYDKHRDHAPGFGN